MMNDPFVIFWSVMIFASIAWYAFLLFYVGYKGGQDIKKMTNELKARNEK
jgi:hypothetical protein